MPSELFSASMEDCKEHHKVEGESAEWKNGSQLTWIGCGWLTLRNFQWVLLDDFYIYSEFIS